MRASCNRLGTDPTSRSGPGLLTPLRVMLPDGEVVEIEPSSVGPDGVAMFGEDWPVDRDEIVYAVRDGGRSILRRTVLP